MGPTRKPVRTLIRKEPRGAGREALGWTRGPLASWRRSSRGGGSGSAGAGSTSLRPDGATTVTTVKSRSVITGRHAFRHGDRRDVQGIVDVVAGQVGREAVRDVVGRHPHLHRVADDVERAAALEARGCFVVDDVHGHVDADLLACLQAHEIDVEREVLHRVELVVARKNARLLALDVDLELRGQEVTREDQLVGGLVIERNGDWCFAAAVDHGGDATLTTNGACGPLATLRPLRSLDLLHCGRHGCIL